MPEMTLEEMNAFLRRPLVAVLTTVRPGGQLHSTPVWFEFENGKFYFWVGEDSVKGKNMRRNPSISVCIATHEEPYQYVSAAGRGVITKQDLAARCSSICRRYYSDESARAFVEADLASGNSIIVTLVPTELSTESAA